MTTENCSSHSAFLISILEKTKKGKGSKLTSVHFSDGYSRLYMALPLSLSMFQLFNKNQNRFLWHLCKLTLFPNITIMKINLLLSIFCTLLLVLFFKKKARGAGIMIAKMMGQHLEVKVDQSHKIWVPHYSSATYSNYCTSGQCLSSYTLPV